MATIKDLKKSLEWALDFGNFYTHNGGYGNPPCVPICRVCGTLAPVVCIAGTKPETPPATAIEHKGNCKLAIALQQLGKDVTFAKR